MPLTPRMLLLGVTALTPAFAWAQALPTGGAYVAGSGSISTAGGTTTIDQSSARGVISWRGFSIGAGQSVQFNNGSGATLNRVTGGQMSSLQGHLGATGSVFLINPNGVVVGPGGTVVTGGSFIASTRDTPDSAFMKGGSVTLSGTSAGTVTNAGRITSTGGTVVLVGNAVSNSGEISAAGGTAALVAGNQVVLSEADGPAGIYVVADSTAKGSVTNTGRIRAAAATLASAGGNVYALAGNREGLVQATGTTTVNGQVWLSAPHGSVSVDGTTLAARNADGSGGVIRANGDTVSLGSGAVLNASATRAGRKGGQILAGTDAAGGVNLARRTTVASGATLKAAGKGKGAGGTIETSAHTMVMGAASISAGQGGSWLLDPDNLTIDSAAATTINSSLASGTDVTEQTSASTASGSGNILLDAPLAWNTGASLTLSAYHSIMLNAGIAVSGAGKLTLTTNSGNSGGYGAVSFGGGAGISFTDVAAGPALTIDGNAYTLLSSASQLKTVASSGYYALATDLDATSLGTLTTSPIPVFYGTFNGLGHAIENLIINDRTDLRVGLFGHLSSGGVISNVGLAGGSVTSTSGSFYSPVGALVGFNDQGATISDVYASASVNSSGFTSYVGGLVGLNYGSITNAYATGSVSVTGNSASVGGLVGLNDSSGSITSTYAAGSVSASGRFDTAGGLVGSNNITVTNSYWNTDTTGQSTGSGVGNGRGLTTAELATGLPLGFDSAIWGNLGNQTTPYLLGVSANQHVLAGSNTIFGTIAGTPVTVILDAAGLAAINSNLSADYGLGANIDASSLDNASPIGASTAFSGIFYGADHTISNLTINDSTDANVGLFGQLGSGSVISNVGLVGGSVIATYNASAAFVGALVGRNNGGTVTNTYATGNVSTTSPNSVAGGLIGVNFGTISNSYATGNVSITNVDSDVGGLVAFNSGTITDAYATGKVSSGSSSANVHSYVGGLAAYNTGTITDAYSIGKVSAAGTGSSVGGLVGLNLGTMADTYWNTDTTGQTNGVGSNSGTGTPTGLTTAQWMTEGPLVNGSSNTFQNASAWISGFPYPLLSALPYIIVTASGTQVYGSSTLNATLGSAVNQSGRDMTSQLSGASIAWQSTATSKSDVGSYTLWGSTAALDGYQVTYASNTNSLAITPAALTITTLNETGTYGQTPTLNSAAYTVSGLLNGDTAPTVTLSTTATGKSNVGSYDIIAGNATGPDAGNYTVTYDNGSYVITPAALTITALDQSGVYGQVPSLGSADYTASGLLNGDTLSGVTLATVATSGSNVGTYALTASNAAGSGLGNYVISYRDGTYTVTPQPQAPSQPQPPSLPETPPYAGMHPVFWPVASSFGGSPVASPQSTIPVASGGTAPGSDRLSRNTVPALQNIPDSTLSLEQARGYRIALPASSYSNRLKDTF